MQQNYRLLDQTRALSAHTRDAAANAVKRGQTFEQITQELTFADFLPTFAGNDVVRAEAFNSFYRSAAVPRALLEATPAVKGQLPPPYPQH